LIDLRSDTVTLPTHEMREATSFRAVTHHGITRADVDRAVAAAAQAAGEVFGD
jgi:threonine aldolase